MGSIDVFHLIPNTLYLYAMVKLNLPSFDCNIRKNHGKHEIFDVVRKKYVILTPEEWVRQHMIHYMSRELNYPLSLMQVERGLTYNKRLKRSDILMYNNTGKPAVLIECKSYKDSELKDHVLHQAAAYNRELKAAYIVITNGWGFYCWHIDGNEITPVKEIPAWEDIRGQGS